MRGDSGRGRSRLAGNDGLTPDARRKQRSRCRPFREKRPKGLRKDPSSPCCLSWKTFDVLRGMILRGMIGGGISETVVERAADVHPQLSCHNI